MCILVSFRWLATQQEYVIVMVSNKKSMAQIAHDLVDFIGDESADQFVAWLSQLLPTFEAQHAQAQAQAPAAPVQAAEPPAEAAAPSDAQEPKKELPAKRVISLKSASSSSPAEPKTVVSLSRGTIRSLNPAKKDMGDVLAKRSQRFGAVDKSALPKKSSQLQTDRPSRSQRGDESREPTTGSKRRANERDAGRLTQRLGPPVNVDQAELDARDSLISHKKKRSGGRGEDDDSRDRNQHNGSRGGRRNDRDQDMEDPGRENKRRGGDSRERAPPLPPSDDREGGKYNNQQRYGQDGRGMGPMGGFQGGPPGYGGYPPPYGAPMFYPPPGFGPMNPYGMGFPPQGMPPPQYGGRSYPQPPGPNMGGMPHGNGPRGARPAFQNRKWVNPNVAKAEEAKAGETNPETEADGAETSGAGLSASAPTFAPRNPYFASSQMRPRFQNKTWVRQDPAKDEELDTSLPKTPPTELLESTE
ncbi:hypothetical protein BBJ28_00019372 [Nothophytophthora sp. Chile5]|nr:hypothetical protein BBJ28_00019372 [Nothophytophthora sp. Chile5]